MSTLLIEPPSRSTVVRGQANERTDEPVGQAWQIRAVWLPDGAPMEEWWLHNGRLTQQPVPGKPCKP